jgi:SAM-dependent methyltransferase
VAESTVTATGRCLSCAALLAGRRLGIGAVPPCNRFERAPNAALPRIELEVTECAACGLVQLDPLPALALLTPRVDWIRYNEPDAHLDELVETLHGRLDLARTEVVGLGPFDVPLLDRLARVGAAVRSADLLSAESARPLPGRHPYLETIQARLGDGTAERLLQVTGSATPTPRLAVCRYLLEHCHDPRAALASMARVAGKGGHLLIEVPDSTKFLARCDYAFLWEEHASYFTEASLRRLFANAGLWIEALLRYAGVLDDALVVLARHGAPAVGTEQPAPPPTPSFDRYAAGLEHARSAYARVLRGANARVAVFGAGHQAVMFIHALRLVDQISYLVDDDARKQGYLAPGTQIPIVPSQAMIADPDAKICLMAVSPRTEGNVAQRCRTLLARGGRVYSIYPGSLTPTLLDEQT